MVKKALLLAPIRREHPLIRAVPPFGVVLGGLEEFGGFGRELLHHRREAHFTFQEVLELIPLRLFRVKAERVLALGFQLRVVTPQMPTGSPKSFARVGCWSNRTQQPSLPRLGSCPYPPSDRG